MEEETITIPLELYQNLELSDKILNALYAAGVDNWVGYDDAMLSIGEE